MLKRLDKFRIDIGEYAAHPEWRFVEASHERWMIYDPEDPLAGHEWTPSDRTDRFVVAEQAESDIAPGVYRIITATEISDKLVEAGGVITLTLDRAIDQMMSLVNRTLRGEVGLPTVGGDA